VRKISVDVILGENMKGGRDKGVKKDKINAKQERIQAKRGG
jgi:hypothetical protein